MGACRTCLIFITIQLVSIATSQEIVKRVPQGFLGMRGKKYFGDESTEQFYKRKPQFFVGVKGKKSLQELLETGPEFEKRAPMGFMGMRGKKDSLFPEYEFNDYAPKRDGSLIGQIDYTSNDRNDQNAFPILNEILQHYLNRFRNPSPTNMYSESSIDEGSNEIEKRAANMHQFFGVRGKKSVNIKRPYDVSFRGKFIGVRGKKDVGVKDDAPAPSEIRFLLNNPLKRKSQMGFFGMRGKKWDDSFESSQEMESPI